MRYEDFKEKEKFDLKINNDVIEEIPIKPSKKLKQTTLENSEIITLTKKDNKRGDHFFFSSFDKNNIKNSKLNFIYFDVHNKEKFLIKIECCSENSNFLCYIRKKVTDKYWKATVKKLNEDDTVFCTNSVTTKNSEEERELKNILETEENICEKIIEVFNLFKYNRYIKNKMENLPLF